MLGSVHSLATGFLPGVRQASEMLWPSSLATQQGHRIFSPTHILPQLQAASQGRWKAPLHKSAGKDSTVPWGCVRVSRELVNSGHQGPGESVQGWWHRAASTSGSITWTMLREAVDCYMQSKTTGLYIHSLTQGTPNKFLNAPVVSGPPPTSMQAYSGFGLLLLFLL